MKCSVLILLATRIALQGNSRSSSEAKSKPTTSTIENDNESNDSNGSNANVFLDDLLLTIKNMIIHFLIKWLSKVDTQSEC